MKKIGYVLFFCLFLSGCVSLGKTNKDAVAGDVKVVTESILPVDRKEKPEDIPQKNTTSNDKIQSPVAFTDEVKADMLRSQQDLYYFTMLDVIQQNVYVEILYGLENYVEEMELSTTDTNQVDKIFQCVLMDHPEIFYTDGYSFVKYTLGDEVQKITFKGTYIYDREEKKQREELIENAVVAIENGIEKEASDYEKVKYVYETMIQNTEYDMLAEDNQNICSVFLNHSSVCQGYAKAVQYLLNRWNVPTILVTGTVENGEGHAWNMVKINDRYYHLDATWGDASYLFHIQEEESARDIPSINYDYLCVTTEEILRTHCLSELVPLPECNSLEDNYYVREGAYFTTVDEEQLKQLFQSYREKERETLTLRCANQEVYQDMVEELLNQQKIFQYFPGDHNSILYTDAVKQLSITFWL